MRLPAFLLPLLLLAPAVNADDCVPSTTTTGLESQVIGPDPVSQLYVVNDLCQPECTFSIWLYQEGNGIEGLQRADEFADDTCGGMIEADAIVNF